MRATTDAALVDAVRVAVHPLTGAAADHDRFRELAGDAPLVLLGGATHGTHEFYRERAEITRRLITESQFTALALEADGPGVQRVDRYVRHAGDDGDAAQALGDLRRFPAWVWRNTDVVEFVEWLRTHNDAQAPDARKVGLSGLDRDDLQAACKDLVVNRRSGLQGRVAVEALNALGRHMAESLETLLAGLAVAGGPAKVVVWAHNVHVGDARAVEMGRRYGVVSLGQLVRERHGRTAVLVGFTTDHGTVTAAPAWGRPAERQRVRPARPASYEAVFHRTQIERFLLPCREADRMAERLRRARLQRALGVVYRPGPGTGAQYFSAKLLEQFDAVLHVDETRAVEPLEPGAEWHAQAA